MKHLDDIKALLNLLQGSERFHALVVVSPPGWGKSTTIDAALRLLDLDHHAVGSYTTPLALYQALCEHPASVLVLDDCAGLFSSVQAMSLLKAATWPSAGSDGTRRVTWASSSDRVGVASVSFSGKVILLANTLPKRLEADAFLSRTLLYRIALDDGDVRESLRAGANSAVHFADTSAATEVAEFLIANVLKSQGSAGLNFRTLQLGYELRCSSADSWQSLLLSLLAAPRAAMDPISVVKELADSGLRVEEQMARFVGTTGLSRRTFQVYRKQLGLSRTYLSRETKTVASASGALDFTQQASDGVVT